MTLIRGRALLLALLVVSFAAEAAGATKGTKRRPTPKSRSAVIRGDAANDASRTPLLTKRSAGSSVLRAQVLLDRAHFSPGEIDGRFGTSTQRAASAFNEARGLRSGARVDKSTWAQLNRDAAPVVATYTILAEDVAGPFLPIPTEVADRAKLAALSFETPLEAFAERFHASPKLLQALNPGAAFDRAGAVLQVPDVTRPALPKAHRIQVSAKDRAVEALSADGSVLARYPATVGSTHDPLPIGEWKINGVGWNPTFHYDPNLFWDAEPGEGKAKLPPGPNNPVGVVWIDLSKPHYGIHGSPEPSTVGGAASHGCIRLTNWDAFELAHLVSPGMRATLLP